MYYEPGNGVAPCVRRHMAMLKHPVPHNKKSPVIDSIDGACKNRLTWVASYRDVSSSDAKNSRITAAKKRQPLEL